MTSKPAARTRSVLDVGRIGDGKLCRWLGFMRVECLRRTIGTGRVRCKPAASVRERAKATRLDWSHTSDIPEDYLNRPVAHRQRLADGHCSGRRLFHSGDFSSAATIAARTSDGISSNEW